MNLNNSAAHIRSYSLAPISYINTKAQAPNRLYKSPHIKLLVLLRSESLR